MRHLCLTAIVVISLLTFSDCSKDDKSSPGPSALSAAADCDLLKTGISTLDTAKVSEAIAGFIRRLPSSSQKHSAANLQKLVDAINGQCSAIAKVVCYACIKTLPEMSEIRVSYTGGAYRVIDISMDKEGTMVYRSMHE